VDKVRRIALVGNGATTRASDNFEGEIWTTASVAKILPKIDRVFEVHKVYDAARLNGYGCPILMDGPHPDVKHCVDLRIDELVATHGPLFQFSYDYMLAYALEEGIKDISLFGIDLATDDEYEHMRLSFYYWIGMLRGSGATVRVSEGSAILQGDWQYCHKANRVRDWVNARVPLIRDKLAEAENERDVAASKADQFKGYREALEDMSRLGV
jgi:hypothetical protein